MSEPFITTHIGDMPINSEGMRTLVDEINRLQAEDNKLKRMSTGSPDIIITTHIGDLPVNPDDM